MVVGVLLRVRGWVGGCACACECWRHARAIECHVCAVEVSVPCCRSVSVYVVFSVDTAPEEEPIKAQTSQNKLVPRRHG